MPDQKLTVREAADLVQNLRKRAGDLRFATKQPSAEPIQTNKGVAVPVLIAGLLNIAGELDGAADRLATLIPDDPAIPSPD